MGNQVIKGWKEDLELPTHKNNKQCLRSLVARPLPSFPSLAVRKRREAGQGPGSEASVYGLKMLKKNFNVTKNPTACGH